ncbi:(R)-phenyllactyl-CoA dehydratase beta subunit [subsurface metagenome]
MDAFETLQKYYSQRDLGAREWKEKGGKVVGFTCTNTPEELLYAANLLPIRLVGDPYEEITLGGLYIEDITSPFVTSIVDLLAKGKYRHIDGFFLTHSSDSFVRLYYNLLAFPEIKPSHLHWLCVPHGRNQRMFKFLVSELERVKKEIEDTYRTEISDDALIKAIKVYNENRQLLREVDNLRREDPPQITGQQAFQIIGSSFFMSKEKHTKLLQQFLEEVKRQPKRHEGVRLYLSGSIQDNLQLVSLIEKLGAVVVSDDLCTGARYFADDVMPSPELSLLENMAEYLMWKAPCPRVSPTTYKVDYLAKTVQEARADGVIFYFLRWEDDHGWQYPDEKAKLDELGIPSILFEQQEYRLAAPEQLRTRIETFIETIKQRKPRE